MRKVAAAGFAAMGAMTTEQLDEAREAGLLYHGGVPGLVIGDWVVPPVESGVEPASPLFTGPRSVRLRTVFVTPSRPFARFVASLWPDQPAGTVYRVEPCGDLSVDIDSEVAGLSLCVGRARVLEVCERVSHSRLPRRLWMPERTERRISDSVRVTAF